MFRKFSAIIQFMLMLVVVATSQPSLSYCLCAHEVYVGGCPCGESLEIADEAILDHSSCSDCCDECLLEKTDPSLQQLEQPPCSNCIVVLSINVDDFTLGSLDVFTTSALESISPQLVEVVAYHFDSQSFPPAIHGIRGSPPPVLTAYSVPIFVRNSAFLL